jgi:hypothetical protein
LESIRKVISILRSLIQRLNLMRLPDCGSYWRARKWINSKSLRAICKHIRTS